ncbi:22242_t:CDS:2, partial [Racocetra persica]
EKTRERGLVGEFGSEVVEDGTVVLIKALLAVVIQIDAMMKVKHDEYIPMSSNKTALNYDNKVNSPKNV